MVKRLYYWGKQALSRIDVFDGREDTAKLPEIPSKTRFAEIHQRILDAQNKLKRKRSDHGLGR